MKKFLSILLALTLMISMGTIAFATDDANEEEPDAATVVDTDTNTADDESDGDGDTETADVVDVVAIADDDKKDGAPVAKGDDTDGLFTGIVDQIGKGDFMGAIEGAFAKAGQFIKDLSLNDILALPTNVMDDIVTGLFTLLAAMGVDVDALYEKLASNKIINWIANFYKGGAMTTTTVEETTATPEVPVTGSSASIAVFATLSLAAAAAFVCLKKKEA
ncbi:MAG: hypothetical protein FWF05_04485 [Oscillospiraceae bacterium]|nr:hypothetical protein [Oscillospiraceae bacterium]